MTVRIPMRCLLAVALVPHALTAQQPDATVRDSHVFRTVTPVFLAVSVADLDASTEWYHRILGLQLIVDVASPDSTRHRILRRNDFVVELIHYKRSLPPTRLLAAGTHALGVQGIFKSGVFVADADSVHAELQRQGVDLDAQVHLDEALGWRTFIFRDLDGNRIQVFSHCGACRRYGSDALGPRRFSSTYRTKVGPSVCRIVAATALGRPAAKRM